MKNNAIMGLGIVLLIVVGAFLAFSSMDSSISENNEQIIEGDTQKVILSQDDLNYKDAYAESGVPIEISADSSVSGCLRSVAFNLNGKKYLKYLKSESDTLILPALEKGTYSFSCSMGMGFGNLVVN